MLATSDEMISHALELSATLEASEAHIAAWREFLAPQPKSLAAQAERIMVRAIAERDAAAETLGAFLTQHGIPQQLLEERRGRRQARSPATTLRVRKPPAAPGTLDLERMVENWRFIAAHVPGLISSRMLKRAQTLGNALLAAEKRVKSAAQSTRARPRSEFMAARSRRKMKRAIAARDAAERNLYDYLARSGMYDRTHLARDFLMEAWKHTMEDAVRPDALPHLDVAAALAARVRAYLDHWAQRYSSKS